jgi:choline kinase
MKLFFLGAGRPAKGRSPAAIKNIALNTRAMDWQISSFDSIVPMEDMHYLGGYHVEEVIKRYPLLNYTIVPDWEHSNIAHTISKAPFAETDTIITYSDTIFGKEVIHDITSIDTDIVICVDSCWRDRYESRTHEDRDSAEILEINIGNSPTIVEFTGLVLLKHKIVNQLTSISINHSNTSFLQLVKTLINNNTGVEYYDVKGNWAEFNSSADIAHFILGTKADTLARLEPLVTKSKIGTQVSFTTAKWQLDAAAIVEQIMQHFAGKNLIVRSSSHAEDSWNTSNAGGFASILNVNSTSNIEITNSIQSVIESYGEIDSNDLDQVLVQALLTDVKAAGVIFTCGLDSGAPYYRFNFDDKNNSTDSVTAGTHSDLRTVLVSKIYNNISCIEQIEPMLTPVLAAVQELEQLLGYDKLDIEFAVDTNNKVHIFQVRPIAVVHDENEADTDDIRASLSAAEQYYTTQQTKTPFIQGKTTLFANMPDWNPAEIIGTRPKPLAFSLYRHLITNEIWARQRAEFGYKDIAPHPLIVNLSGQPYVDVRASFNSFIPAQVSDSVANKVVNAYMSLLLAQPHLHDKIEFDIAFTIWTPDFAAKAEKRLQHFELETSDVKELENGLKIITRNALKRLPTDIKPINTLIERREMLCKSELSTLDRAYALLDDCKQFGTLAFAHAARAGFIATTLLRYFVDSGSLCNARKMAFLESFTTVAGDFEQQKYLYASEKIELEHLITQYGHLRPGTYEITVPAYWEDPERYIKINDAKLTEKPHSREFSFSEQEIEGFQNLIHDLQVDISPYDLTKYIINAIQAREYVKFQFTKNLSLALDNVVQWGQQIDINRENMSFIEYDDLVQYKLNIISTKVLQQRISKRKHDYITTCAIELPPIIKNITDFYCFERHAQQPNFVTINRVEAAVQILDQETHTNIEGKIAVVPQADPGYDWLFGHGIVGLITKYGGANSHMAIRAAELGLPAAIGVGEQLYDAIAKMLRLELDCANQVIRPTA